MRRTRPTAATRTSRHGLTDDAWREALAEQDIALVVTAVTATPKWDVRSKAQAGLAKRACTVLGVEVGEFTSNIHHRPLRVR